MATDRQISRRMVLTGIGGMAAASILAACGASAPVPTATVGSKATTAAIVPQLAPVMMPSPAASGSAPAATSGSAATLASASSAPASVAAATSAPTVAPTMMPAASPTAAAMPMAAMAPIKRGGQLRILQLNDFAGMDPIYSLQPGLACHDWLVSWRPNEQGQFGVQPMLAKSWDIKGNTIVFHLQEGVKFHDGSDLNADAVVWNLKRMVQQPKSQATALKSLLDKNNPAQALDPMTVQVNMPRPSVSVLSQLSETNNNSPIVSKKAADDHGEDWLKTNAVGTGPFKFVSWTSGDRLVVTRNENYWRKGADGKPLPYVDGATYRVIIEVSTQFNEMRAGTADYMSNLPGQNVAAAKQLPGVRYIDSPYFGTKKQFLFNGQVAPFKDNLPLRQAIQHAVDRDALIKALDPALGIPLPYEFVPGAVGYDTKVPFYDFNLDKANALMKMANVQTPVTVRLTAHNRELDQAQAQLLQAMLGKIGVKVNLDIIERTAWNTKVHLNHDFEMATRQGGVATDPANDLLSTWAEGDAGYTHGVVPGLIDLLNQADSTFDDTQRQAIFIKAQNLMYDSAWFGYMWFENGNFLVHKRIQNFPNIWGALREAEWWISE